MENKLMGLFIGLDLGQKVDRTVLTLLEKRQEYGYDMFEGKNPIGKPYYILSYMERFPLDVPSPQQVDRVKMIYDQVIKKYNPEGERRIKPTVIVDMGNVGSSHFEQYVQLRMQVYGVNFLGDGTGVSRDGRVYGVPKKDLASALSVVIENDRLIIPEEIPERDVIIRELSKFTWKQTDSGRLTVENLKDSDHDDIPCSLMVAIWFAETQRKHIDPESLKAAFALRKLL